MFYQEVLDSSELTCIATSIWSLTQASFVDRVPVCCSCSVMCLITVLCLPSEVFEQYIVDEASDYARTIRQPVLDGTQ